MYQYSSSNDSYQVYSDQDNYVLEKSIGTTLTLLLSDTFEKVKLMTDESITMYPKTEYRGNTYLLKNDMKNIYHLSHQALRATIEGSGTPNNEKVVEDTPKTPEEESKELDKVSENETVEESKFIKAEIAKISPSDNMGFYSNSAEVIIDGRTDTSCYLMNQNEFYSGKEIHDVVIELDEKTDISNLSVNYNAIEGWTSYKMILKSTEDKTLLGSGFDGNKYKVGTI